MGAGWTGLTASYLEDALGDLLMALRLLVGGDRSVRALAEEPGEYSWVLDRSGDVVRVRILTLADIYDDLPDDAWEVVSDQSCDFIAFVAAIAEGARNVLEEHRESGTARSGLIRTSLPNTSSR